MFSRGRRTERPHPQKSDLIDLINSNCSEEERFYAHVASAYIQHIQLKFAECNYRGVGSSCVAPRQPRRAPLRPRAPPGLSAKHREDFWPG